MVLALTKPVSPFASFFFLLLLLVVVCLDGACGFVKYPPLDARHDVLPFLKMATFSSFVKNNFAVSHEMPETAARVVCF